jgi:vacuolar-type H+-ATPase subunit I/STV1
MLNTVHFGLWLDFLFEWLPQQVFLFSTFGYMCLLIIKKWTIPWGIEVPTSMAPSIIGQMIAMPLKMGSTEGKVMHFCYLASMGSVISRSAPTHSIESIDPYDPNHVDSQASFYVVEGSMDQSKTFQR